MHSLPAFVCLLAAAGLVLPALTAGGAFLPTAPVGHRLRRRDAGAGAALTPLIRLPRLSPNAVRREGADREHDQDEDEDEEIPSPHQFAECCGLAADATCRQACLSALGSGGAGGATLGKVLDAVQRAGCGLMPHDPQWTCFLSHSRGSQAGAPDAGVLDAGRLHCCGLARWSGCRRACQRAFRHDWGAAASNGPLQDCVSRANESALASCLAEVDHPCRPASACSGLDFCAAVLQDDGRSWFRTCNAQADDAARRVAAGWWRDGELPLSGPGSGPGAHRAVPLLRGLESCDRGLWAALSCLTHAQPCSPRAGSLPLCIQDCLRLLPRCVRWSAVPPGFSAEQLCAQLAGPPPCVAIPTASAEFAPESAPESAPKSAKQQPEADPRAPRDACSLGAASDVTVPVGTAVRVPREGASSPCYSACLCEAAVGRRGGAALGRCVDLPCLPHAHTCALGQGTVEHRRTVVQGCLVCTCSSGDVLCTQRPCAAATAALSVAAPSAASPCRCPPHRVPVCGRNGRTYGNACLTRCAGLDDRLGDGEVSPGPCPLLDPCAAPANGTRCPGKQRCVPDRRVCLSLLAKPCPQYKCVEPPPRCDLHNKTPVCDTAGRTHSSACSLLQAGAAWGSSLRLRHRGECLPADRGPVCGADGYTYPSRGTAEEALVPVDYVGACAQDCDAAPCPALPPGCIRGVRPGDSCCEACVGVLHAAVNTKALDKAVLAVGRLAEPWPRAASVFSLQALLGQLQEQVLAACAVRGYLTRAEQLAVVLRPVAEDAGAVRACHKEAERLAGLFQQSAARVQASLLLSAVVAVDLLPGPVVLAAPDREVSPDAAPVGAVRDAPLLLLLLLLLVHLVVGLMRSER